MRTCWFVGDADRAEFRSMLAETASELSESSTCYLENVSAVEDRIVHGAPPPDLLIVFESWPDEFPADHVSRLFAAAPLARIVCVGGAWCESAGRTRSHWPLGLRVPVWLATVRIRYELDVLAGRRPALPPTATREEWILAGVHGVITF